MVRVQELALYGGGRPALTAGIDNVRLPLETFYRGLWMMPSALVAAAIIYSPEVDLNWIR